MAQLPEIFNLLNAFDDQTRRDVELAAAAQQLYSIPLEQERLAFQNQMLPLEQQQLELRNQLLQQQLLQPDQPRVRDAAQLLQFIGLGPTNNAAYEPAVQLLQQLYPDIQVKASTPNSYGLTPEQLEAITSALQPSNQ